MRVRSVRELGRDGTLEYGADVRRALCREAVPQIAGRNWESPHADRSKVEG